MPQPRILIIDDLNSARKTVVKLLADEGLTDIVQASNGEEGWRILKSCENTGDPIALVLSDSKTPKLSGLDLLKRVREDSQLTLLPFILITSNNDAQLVKEARKCGVSDSISKPFSGKSLCEKVLSALNGMG